MHPLRTLTKRRALLAAFLTAVMLLFVGWRADRVEYTRLMNDQRNQAALALSPYAHELESIVSRRLSLLAGLRAFVLAHEGERGFGPRFESFAAGLSSGTSGIVGLALVPLTGRSYSYPDVGTASDLRPEFFSSSRNLELKGPAVSNSGRQVLVATMPVRSGNTLWGGAVLALDFGQILAEAGLKTVTPGLVVALRDEALRTVHGEETVWRRHPVAAPVRLPNRTWELAAAPVKGWPALVAPTARLHRMLGLGVVALLTLVAFLAFEGETRLRFELRTRKRQYQLAMDSVPVPLAYIDRHRLYRFRNDAHRAWFGGPEQGEVEKVLGEAGYTRIRVHLDRVLGGAPAHFDMTRVDRAGRDRQVHCIFVPHSDDAGTVLGAYLITVDVTERRVAELALERESRNNRALAELSAAIVSAPSPREISRRVLATALELTGSPEGFSGYVDPDATRIVAAEADGVMDPQHEIVRWALDHRKQAVANEPPAGSGISAGRFISVPAVLEDKMLGLVVVAGKASDYTGHDLQLLDRLAGLFALALDRERKQREVERALDELGRSNRDLEQFAYLASHDLQEPLRVVRSFLELLSDTRAGALDAEAKSWIGFAVDAATRMQNLISDLLAYSRVGTRRDKLEETDCGTVVRRALDNLAITVLESGASITLGPMPMIVCDGRQLLQVFQNLLSNSLKFRGSKAPVIRVSAEQNGGEWIFSVADNGIGIAPEHREAVFEIFRRLHGRTEYPGTGIGLAICRKVVERHGGRIWVESEPGCGSMFRFTIPLIPVETPAIRTLSPAGSTVR